MGADFFTRNILKWNPEPGSEPAQKIQNPEPGPKIFKPGTRPENFQTQNPARNFSEISWIFFQTKYFFLFIIAFQ